MEFGGVMFSCVSCGLIRYGNSKSSIEEKVYRELIKIFREGIDFCPEFVFHCKYNYRLDFYFPVVKLAIECDGKYWHDKDHDRKRDHYFKNKGILTLRFTDDEIMNDIKSVIEKIKKVYYERKNNICSN